MHSKYLIIDVRGYSVNLPEESDHALIDEALIESVRSYRLDQSIRSKSVEDSGISSD